MSVPETIELDARAFDPIAWSASTLLRQGMPDDEVRAVLSADRPEAVRQHLELHRERLEEALCGDLALVDRIEHLLPVPGR